MFRNAMFCLLGFILNTANASAKPCASVDDNSCWTVINYNTQPVDIGCTTASWTLIALNAMPSGSKDTMQFDTGYGDGLGFPEPGVLVNCSARLASGRQAKVAFSTIGWGDRVEIRVDRDQLRATSTEHWHQAPARVVAARLSAQ